LDPVNVVNLSMGAIWNFGKGTALLGAQRACFMAYVKQACKGSNPNTVLYFHSPCMPSWRGQGKLYLFYCILCTSTVHFKQM